MSMGSEHQVPEVRPDDVASPYSPVLRKVIEDPQGAFQKWKRGEITYLQMCGDFTKELTLARVEAATSAGNQRAEKEALTPIG
jgi:hypothetical protein